MNRIKPFLSLLLLALLAPAVAQGDAAAQDAPATVVDIATGNEDFSTLVTALTEAGLVDTLMGEGPFTVFAPTNAAFEEARASLGITVEELLARDDLADILTYHVVPGRLLAADVVAAVESAGGTATVTTVQGADVSVTLMDGNVLLNDAATVITTDLEAGNGVVHVIDTVLLPPTE